MSILDSEFQKLLSTCTEVSSMFPDGIVYIGGIAIYLHTINLQEIASYAETTHDADFYISMADMSDLRDIEEVTPNRRLNKHQFIKNNFEFDIYTERYSSLIVPYDQIQAYSEKYDSISVACIEHLLVLKLEALLDRFKSSKGAKDIKDIIRISQIIETKKLPLRINLVEGYLSANHQEMLKQIEKSPEFLSIAKGNAKLAKTLRTTYAKHLSILN